MLILEDSYFPPSLVSPGGVIEIGEGEVVTYHDVIEVACTEKHHGKTSAVSQCQQ